MPSLFDNLVLAFHTVALLAQPTVVSYGHYLFVILLGFSGILTALSIIRGEPLIPCLIYFALQTSIAAAAIRMGFSLSMEIGHFLEGLGQQLSHTSSLNPQVVMQSYVDIVTTLGSIPLPSSWLADIQLFLHELLTGGIMVVSGAVLVAFALESVIEFQFRALLSAFVFAFAAFEWTRDWAWGWLEGLVKNGIRMLGFYLVINAAEGFATFLKAEALLACKPVTSTVLTGMGAFGTGAGFASVTTCSGSVPASSLWMFDAAALVLGLMGVVLPFMLASGISGHLQSGGSRIVQGIATVGRML